MDINDAIRYVKREILNTWNGKKDIRNVFWHYKVILGIIVTNICIKSDNYAPSLFPILMAAYAAYNVWIIRGVWLCSANCKSKMLEFAAKILILIQTIIFTVVMIIFFESSITSRTFDDTAKDSKFLRSSFARQKEALKEEMRREREGNEARESSSFLRSKSVTEKTKDSEKKMVINRS